MQPLDCQPACGILCMIRESPDCAEKDCLVCEIKSGWLHDFVIAGMMDSNDAAV